MWWPSLLRWWLKCFHTVLFLQQSKKYSSEAQPWPSCFLYEPLGIDIELQWNKYPALTKPNSIGFSGSLVEFSKQKEKQQFNTGQLRNLHYCLELILLRKQLSLNPRKLTRLSRAFFCQPEHMIVSSPHRTERKRRRKWRQIWENLCVNKQHSLLIWTCSSTAPPRWCTLRASAKHTIIHTHPGHVAAISGSSGLRSWQQRTGTERPSTPNCPDWLDGGEAVRCWAISGSCPASFGRQRTWGNRLFWCVEGYRQELRYGPALAFQEDIVFQCRFISSCMRII